MKNDLLIWLDLETTGLKYEEDYILEVAMMATNLNLVRLDSLAPASRLCFPPPQVLHGLHPEVEKMHKESGLLADLDFYMPDPPDDGFSPSNDEAWVYERLTEWRDARVVDGVAPKLILAGSSIHFDRAFIRRFWPRVDQILHYRMVDVSSIKILVQSWFPEKYHTKGVNKHRAAADVEESLRLLRNYREMFFRDPEVMETDKVKENILHAINHAVMSNDRENSGKNAEHYAKAYQILCGTRD